MPDGGVLTWRNVDAPNYSGTLDAIKASGAALSSAVTGASDGLSKFDASRKQDAEDAVVRAAQSYATPDALHAAIASGDIYNGIDKSLIGTHAVNAVNSVGANLLSQALGNQQYNQNTLTMPLQVTKLQQDNDLGASNLRVATATEPTKIKQAAATLDSTIAGTAGQDATTARTKQLTADDAQNQPYTLQTLKTGAAKGQYDFQAEQDKATGAQAFAQTQALSPNPDDWEANRAQYQQSLSPAAFAEYDRQYTAAKSGAPITINGQPAGGVTPNGAVPGTPVGSGGSIIGSAIAGPQPSYLNSLPAETQKYVPKILAAAGGADALPKYVKNADGSSNSMDIAKALTAPQMAQESAGDPTAVSPKGAQGLMQLMPGTAASLEKQLGMPPGLTQQNTPQGRAANILAGQTYLAQQIDANGGDAAKGLAAYNAGPDALKNALKSSTTFDETTPEKLAAKNADFTGQAAQIVRGVNAVVHQQKGQGVGTNAYAEDTRTTLNPGEKVLPQDQSPDDVVSALTAPGHSLSAVPADKVQSALQDLHRRAGVSWYMAGQLLQAHGIANTQSALQRPFFDNTVAFGDQSALSNDIVKLKNGGYDTDLNTQQTALAGASKVSQLLAQHTADSAGVQAARNRLAINPNARASYDAAVAKENLSSKMLSQAIAAGHVDPMDLKSDLRYKFTPPTGAQAGDPGADNLPLNSPLRVTAAEADAAAQKQAAAQRPGAIVPVTGTQAINAAVGPQGPVVPAAPSFFANPAAWAANRQQTAGMRGY